MSENVVKKPLYKAWWFWLVLGIISTLLFGVMCACTDTDTYNADNKSFGDSIVTTSTASEETTTAETTTHIETTAEPTTIPEITEQETTVKQTQTPAPVVDVAPLDEQEDYGYAEDFPVIEEEPVEDKGQNYVLNNNTYKFHYPGCHSAKRIKSHNREDYYGTREELISWGYDPCGNCNP